jgi:colanic acid/amylovoran biosynthesis glycosyltransferase
MAERLADLGCPRDKLRVHHLGVDPDKFPFARRARAKGEAFRILMVARFQEKKGYVHGLHALGALKTKFDFEITIIGDGPISETREVLGAIADAGLGERVRLLGRRTPSEVTVEMHRSHILLAPSATAADGDNEGGAPVAIIEAMATGLPLVATRHCDIPNVVVDGVTGFLAAERDVRGLAQALERMFLAEVEWGAIGSLARKRIESEFNSQTQGKRLAALYTELFRSRRISHCEF